MWYFLVGLVLGGALVLGSRLVIGTRSTGSKFSSTAEPTHATAADAPPDNADSGERWENVLDALPLGVVVIGPDGVERLRNSTARSIAGARHADVLIDAAVERMISLALGGNDSEEQIQLAGPPQRVLTVRATPLVGGGALATIEDISERWRLDQVRTDFVANVSHELKTPVGAISVLAETIEGESTDDVVLRLVRRMIGESSRMTRTIDDLLELSRIEMGGDMTTSPVDINDVVNEAIERVQPIAAHDGVRIEVTSSPDAVVSGDFFQLASAVGNLVDNAVKYGQSGGQVEVTVSDQGDAVVVEVTDHGVGIPPESLDRIFERFYRVDRARSRVTGGTGLGLAIVRHVATNHGGEVNVRSREGEGSTFSLRIPRNVARSAGTIGVDGESARDHR